MKKSSKKTKYAPHNKVQDQLLNRIQSPYLNIKMIVIFFSIVLLLLVPWAFVKFLILCGLITYIPNSLTLTKTQTTALLMILFSFAYLISPYWLAPVLGQKHLLGDSLGANPTMFVSAIILLIIAALWAKAAAGDLRLAAATEQRKLDRFLWPAIIAAVLLVLNFRAMNYDIPIYGDEDWHIWRLSNLYGCLKEFFSGEDLFFKIIILSLVLLIALFINKPKPHIKTLILVGILTSVAIISGVFDSKTIAYLVLRYPFISCWLHLLGPVGISGVFDEAVYRIIPMAAVFAIGYYLFRQLRDMNFRPFAAVLTSLAIVTAPALFYHTTILYLELPALVLLVIALCQIERLIKEDFARVRTCAGWYALLAMGFIKETLIAIVIALLILRILYRVGSLLKNGSLSLQSIRDEIVFCLCVIAPIGIYIFIRMFFGNIRGYTPQFAHLINLSLWLNEMRFLWSQFGLLLIFAIAGLATTVIERKFLRAAAIVFIFAAEIAFHLVDSSDYVGLARFNLFFFAPLTVCALSFLSFMSARSSVAVYAAAIILFAANIAMSPVAISGEKAPLWASPEPINCEFYFAKDDAVRWLKDNRPNARLIVAGTEADSKIKWYFAKERYQPAAMMNLLTKHQIPWRQSLAEAITEAGKRRADTVLFFKMEPPASVPDEYFNIGGYRLVRIFENKYVGILLYENNN